MRFTIYGYNQNILAKYNFDGNDALLLRTIADIFSSKSEKIKSIFVENNKFIWLTYKFLSEELPVLGSARTIKRKIDIFAEKKILKRIFYSERNGVKGSYMYIGLGENYDELTTTCQLPPDKISTDPLTTCQDKHPYTNNPYTNIKKKYIKPKNCQPFIIDILKKYEELGLPDYEFLPDNSVFVNCIQALGAEKLMKALEIISESQFARTFSINMIFSVKNLKKALNGNFNDRKKPKAVPFAEPEYKEDEETLKALERLGF